MLLLLIFLLLSSSYRWNFYWNLKPDRTTTSEMTHGLLTGKSQSTTLLGDFTFDNEFVAVAGNSWGLVDETRTYSAVVWVAIWFADGYGAPVFVCACHAYLVDRLSMVAMLIRHLLGRQLAHKWNLFDKFGRFWKKSIGKFSIVPDLTISGRIIVQTFRNAAENYQPNYFLMRQSAADASSSWSKPRPPNRWSRPCEPAVRVSVTVCACVCAHTVRLFAAMHSNSIGCSTAFILWEIFSERFTIAIDCVLRVVFVSFFRYIFFWDCFDL